MHCIEILFTPKAALDASIARQKSDIVFAKVMVKWKRVQFFWLAVFYGYTEIDMRVLFTLDGNDKGLRGHSKKICKPRFNTDINPVVSKVPKFVQTRCICLPCAALSWGQPTWQGLGFGGLVHEETHPCASNLIQSIFLFWVHQQCPGPDCSICQWLDLRKNIS